MKARVKTPVKGYNGFSVGLQFTNGCAEGDISQAQLDYFKTSGYLVTLLEMPELVEKPIEDANTEEPKKASPKKRSKRSKKC